MKLWTIYKNPKDFPDQYVARMYDLDEATDTHFAADTLDPVRTWVIEQAAKEGVSPFCLPPQKDDDAFIVEVWV